MNFFAHILAYFKKEPEMSLDSLKALIADAVSAADRLIAKAEADAAAAAQAVDNAIADAEAEVKVLADKIIGAAPPPPDPAPVDPNAPAA